MGTRAGERRSRGDQAWLYGIAANRFRSRGRTNARALRALGRLAGQQSPAESPTDDAVDALASEDTLVRVHAAMARLAPSDREVIVLFAWEQLSYEEIAAALGIELGTVRSRLSRARARLRELAGTNGESSDDKPHRVREIVDG